MPHLVTARNDPRILLVRVPNESQQSQDLDTAS